jgi:hypothetical protein
MGSIAWWTSIRDNPAYYQVIWEAALLSNSLFHLQKNGEDRRGEVIFTFAMPHSLCYKYALRK